MTIQALFIMSNEALLKVVMQISGNQWDLAMPPGMSSKPGTLGEAVRWHTYDDAWVPDVLAGKTKTEVGDEHDRLLKVGDIKTNYSHFNMHAIDAVRDFNDLEYITHLSYGDFPAKDYLQHITCFRALRSYDIAKLIGIDAAMTDDFVRALTEEFSPVAENYRKMGVFPPPLEVAYDATPQAKLLAMVGRK